MSANNIRLRSDTRPRVYSMTLAHHIMGLLEEHKYIFRSRALN